MQLYWYSINENCVPLGCLIIKKKLTLLNILVRYSLPGYIIDKNI